MGSHRIFLVAYDVTEPRRWRQVYRYLLGYRVGGQKSVLEVMATPTELRDMREALMEMIDSDEDRLHIVALDPRMDTRCLGVADSFKRGHFSIV